MAKKLFGPLCGVTVAALLLAAGGAQADDIPWSYHGTSTSASAGSSSVNFLGQANNVTNGSGVVFFNLSTTSNAPTASPDHFQNVPYSFNVNVSDTNSLGSGTESGTLTFAGTLSADISKGNVNNFTFSPTNTTGNLVLGDDAAGWRNYKVILDSSTPPGPPAAPVGAIHGEVTITPTDGPGGGNNGGGNNGGGNNGGPQDSPEPASLLLAGFGLSALGLAALRRRRKPQS